MPEDTYRNVSTKELIAIMRDHNRKSGFFSGEQVEELMFRLEQAEGSEGVAHSAEDGEVFKKTNKKAKAGV